MDREHIVAELDDLALKVLGLVPFEGQPFHERQADIFKRLHAIARTLEGGEDGR